MRSVRIGLLGVVLVALVSGCAASGTSSGRLSVRGTLTSTEGTPLPNQELQFLLPAAYGLGGLDLVLNKPEDFGHQDHVFRVRTGPGGEFSSDLGMHIYHISFWLLPPLGGIPRHPPAPFLLVRVTSVPDEYYAVQTDDGKFKVFTDNGMEKTLEGSHLSELIARVESGSGESGSWTAGIIDLRISPGGASPNKDMKQDVE